MLRIHPTFWPTVFTIPALIVLIGLGTWQLDRLAWKTGLIADIQSRIAAPPASLADLLAGAGDDLDSLQYRRVSLTGSFRHDGEMYLAARSMNGNPGYHVVTPFAIAGDGTVLIDRGWVPLDRKEPSDRAAGQVEGEVAIEGVVRVPRPEKSWLQPDNEPDHNMWFWVDLPAMTGEAMDTTGIGDDMAPVYVEAGPAENPGGFPIGGQTRVNLPNDHLQYAITWYSFAVILAVIYVIYHRKPKEGAKAD